ncbi:RNA polymerase factor sigma-54 [Acidobacteriota bacterium]
MVLEQKLRLKMTQKLMMTPQLQQAIKLLQYHKLELHDVINQELVENPLLEEVLSDQKEESAEETADRQEETKAQSDEKEPELETNTQVDEIDYEAFFKDLDEPYQRTYIPREVPEAFQTENTLAHEITLPEHLLWQVGEVSTSEEIAEIGRGIIGNLNSDGYLVATIDEIMTMGQWSEQDTLEALKLVQSLDPVGVGARDLQECLLIQLKYLDLDESPAEQIITEHLDLLKRHRYDELAKKLGCSIEMVRHWVEIIRNLDPRPGDKYSSEQSYYVVPDVYVTKLEGEYVIILNDEGLPRLRINSHYRKLLKESDGKKATPEIKTFINDKFKSAIWLIRSLEQRQRTIFKVSESIVKHQRDFLEKGVEFLQPLVLRDIAEDIDMHESTVSRVVTKKYMHTPQGLFEMKFFFHSGIQSSSGRDVSSISVKQKIKRLIEAEDEKHPISDSQVVNILRSQGLDIARRTVAKYREEMKIPSSTYRKKIG